MDIQPYEKKILRAIAGFERKGTPSNIVGVARKLNYAPQTVHQVVNRLEASGRIESQKFGKERFLFIKK